MTRIGHGALLTSMAVRDHKHSLIVIIYIYIYIWHILLLNKLHLEDDKRAKSSSLQKLLNDLIIGRISSPTKLFIAIK